MKNATDILQFWFEEAGPRRWFKKSEAFDAVCKEQFLPTLVAASKGECWEWRKTPEGRCAEIIVLDQFSRNIFREDARSYAQDGMALALAQEAVASGDDQGMNDDQRYFTYMPYMHSESLAVHEQGMQIFETLGNTEALRYEKAHRDVIQRFGRYPSRNAVLGRHSTSEELEYLKSTTGF
ncbi:DUF924 family protein [Congregibacter variabilis]|uniref:DUF924 family protein n=1 Tax=Congregibacter variabilis TaxID=3081200 RepID=A0ABZ0I5M4_9GAMM|nr:DUF924 family protein [Congregibacter sp. IMCC43200]